MRAWVTTLLTLVVSAAALWLVWRLADGVVAFGALPSPKSGWTGAVVLLHLGVLALLTLRWWLLARLVLGRRDALSYRTFAVLIWGGQGFSQIALGPISADAVRIVGLNSLGAGLADTMRIVLLDRLVGLSGLLLVGAAALATIFRAPLVLGWLATLMLAGLVTGVILAKLPRLSPQIKKVVAMCTQVVGLRMMLGLILMSALTHGLNIGIYYCIAQALGFAPPLAATISAVAAGLLSASLPISFGGWGLRELTISQAFVAQNIAFPASVTVSVLFALTHIAMGLPGLILLAIRTRFSVDRPKA